MSQQMVIFGSAGLFSLIVMIVVSIVIYYMYSKEEENTKTTTTASLGTTTTTTTASLDTKETSTEQVVETTAPVTTQAPVTEKATTTTVAPVTTQAPVPYNVFKHYASGKCLDGNGEKVYFFDCKDGNDFQQWKLEQGMLKHKQSGKCLDSDGNSVYFGNCQQSNEFQKWEKSGNLIKHLKSGKCLDGNGTSIYMRGCQVGNTYQSWNTEEITEKATTTTAAPKTTTTTTVAPVTVVDPLVNCKVTYADKIETGDIVFINSSDKKCYKCTAGRYTREDLQATSDKACKGTQETIKQYAVSQGKLSSSEGVSLDSNIVFACPENTSRNLEPISSETPCVGKCSSLYGPASFEHLTTGDCKTCQGGSRNANLAGSGKECSRDCESGYLPDPNGKCYKCKDGSSKTLYPVDDPKACSTGIFNGDILSPAIFGKDWLYSWRSDGKNTKPLKLKENIYSKATLLG